MNLPMMRHSVMLAATVVGLTAGSDDLKPDLAACKAKTMELSKSADVGGGTYRECMRAQGWPLRDACLDTRHTGVLPNVISGKRGKVPRCRSAATAGGNNAFSPHRHFQRNSSELVHIDDKFQAPQWR